MADGNARVQTPSVVENWALTLELTVTFLSLGMGDTPHISRDRIHKGLTECVPGSCEPRSRDQLLRTETPLQVTVQRVSPGSLQCGG